MTTQAFAAAADVLARLRLPDTHPDAGFVTSCTDEANELVSAWLGIGDLQPALSPVPAGVVNATVEVATRLYRAKDATSDVSESWGDLGAGLRIPRDPLAGVSDRLAPYRPGVAWAPGDVAHATPPPEPAPAA